MDEKTNEFDFKLEEQAKKLDYVRLKVMEITGKINSLSELLDRFFQKSIELESRINSEFLSKRNEFNKKIAFYNSFEEKLNMLNSRKNFLENESYRADLKKEQEETHKKYISVKYWYDLVFEAEMVINNNIHEVSIKYVELTDMLYLEQIFDADIKSAIINIEFTNYVESLENEIIGPVVLNFRSHSDRVHNKEQTIRVMQKTLKPCRPEQTAKMGGCMMASCYHIGPHETIHETYEKMHTWMRRHGYVPGADSYERYVTDYWTTRNAAQFVTEIMIQASRR